MSQAIRSFFKILNRSASDSSISEKWATLSVEEQGEAVELARASDTMEMEVLAVIGYDLDEILAS